MSGIIGQAGIKKRLSGGCFLSWGKANFRRTNLARARMRKLDLRCANMRHANLEGVNFAESDLRGTDLYKARLTGTSWRDVRIDGRTNLQRVNFREKHSALSDDSDRIKLALRDKLLDRDLDRFSTQPLGCR